MFTPSFRQWKKKTKKKQKHSFPPSCVFGSFFCFNCLAPLILPSHYYWQWINFIFLFSFEKRRRPCVQAAKWSSRASPCRFFFFFFLAVPWWWRRGKRIRAQSSRTDDWPQPRKHKSNKHINNGLTTRQDFSPYHPIGKRERERKKKDAKWDQDIEGEKKKKRNK